MVLLAVSAVVAVLARPQTLRVASSTIGDQKVDPGPLLKSARNDAQKKPSSQLLNEIARAKDLTASMLERLAGNRSVMAIQPAVEAALQ